MNEEQIKWLKEQKDTRDGELWIKFIADYANMLYNVRGVPIDEVRSRQLAAEHLERIVALSKDKEPIKRINEYL